MPATPNIALFSESEGETPVMFVGNELGLTAGVTQVSVTWLIKRLTLFCS